MYSVEAMKGLERYDSASCASLASFRVDDEEEREL